MAKKVYAVKKGFVPGIYTSWSECQEQINGFSGAEFKGFSVMSDAEAYMNENSVRSNAKCQVPSYEGIVGKCYAVRVGRVPGIYATWDECQKQTSGFSGAEYQKCGSVKDAEIYMGYAEEDVKSADVVAYVDGSFNAATSEYGYGVILFYKGEEITLKGKGSDERMVSMRNVAGEILGASKAMQFALKNGAKTLLIYHDYEGIAKWCTKDWKTNKEGTIAYQKYYDSVSSRVKISFEKVVAHSNNKYNEIADQLAKEGCGVS